jgi:hypothetical protein
MPVGNLLLPLLLLDSAKVLCAQLLVLLRRQAERSALALRPARLRLQQRGVGVLERRVLELVGAPLGVVPGGAYEVKKKKKISSKHYSNVPLAEKRNNIYIMGGEDQIF